MKCVKCVKVKCGEKMFFKIFTIDLILAMKEDFFVEKR